MKTIKFLLVGESWVSNNTYFKGWDNFTSTFYNTSIETLEKAFSGTEIEFIHMPGHMAAREFPLTIEELNKYDVVCLSDVGANTLLLHPDTWYKGKSVPNRLKLLAEWVRSGGGLCMCGGYYSFAGIYGASKYYNSPIEDVLPVKIFPYDDRVETPEGLVPDMIDQDHEIVKDIDGDWPALLGFNDLNLKEGSHLIVNIENKPLLVVREVEKGRTLAWASDIGPHWCPTNFTEWVGYSKLWTNAVRWLSRK